MKKVYRLNSKPRPGHGYDGERLWWVEESDGRRWRPLIQPGALAKAERIIAQLRGPKWTYGIKHR